MNYQFITHANAQEVATTAATAPAEQFQFTSLVPLILIFGVFYLLIIRPQSKKMKEQQELLKGLKINDKIITNAGIVGVVKDIDDKENMLEVEIANGVVVKMLRSYVVDLLNKKDLATKNDKKSSKK